MKKIFRALVAFLGLLALAEIADLVWLGHVRATINSANSSIVVSGNGSQTVFSFPFIGVAPADISVVFTDVNGNQTTLVQNTQYTVSLNAPVAPNIWGLGGSITYPLVGSPIASGTTLTISRSLPITQTVSSNNGQAFPLPIEAALDLLTMEIQQVNSAFSRALVQPLSDTCSLSAMPSSIQRANNVLGFDSTGCNPVMLSTLPAGAVSSAMQPVVNASTLANGRTAFGLGSAATGNVNFGLQSGVSGVGNLDADFATASDSTNQSVAAAFHLTQRFATAAITYTLPRANTVWNGFGFWITALNGPVTLAPNAADNFAGMASGGAYVIPVGTSLFVTTNAAASGTWWIGGEHLVTGLNAPRNLQINASVASNALTVAIKDSNGNDPSATSPVLVAFQSPSIPGGVQIAAITGPLSITAPVGASLGTANGVPFRLWVGLFNNSGNIVLGLYQSVTGGASPSAVTPWNETTFLSPTAISAGSTAPATWYAGSAPSNVALRVVGFIEFRNGQPTAGTWSLAPFAVQLFGPGVKKPGDIVQVVAFGNSAFNTVSNSTFVTTTLSTSITPFYSEDLVKVEAYGNAQAVGPGCATFYASLYRNNATIRIGNTSSVFLQACQTSNTNGVIGGGATVNAALDAPGGTGSTTYGIAIAEPTGSVTWTFQNNGSGFLTMEEISP